MGEWKYECVGELKYKCMWNGSVSVWGMEA